MGGTGFPGLRQQLYDHRFVAHVTPPPGSSLLLARLWLICTFREKSLLQSPRVSVCPAPGLLLVLVQGRGQQRKGGGEQEGRVVLMFLFTCPWPGRVLRSATCSHEPSQVPASPGLSPQLAPPRATSSLSLPREPCQQTEGPSAFLVGHSYLPGPTSPAAWESSTLDPSLLLGYSYFANAPRPCLAPPQCPFHPVSGDTYSL